MIARVIVVPVAVAAVVALLVLAFVWPTVKAAPAGLDLAVTGDPALVAAFQQNAASQMGEAVSLVTVADRDAIVTGIQSRDYIGGLVLDPAASEVLLSTAAGQAQTQIMNQVAAQLQTSLHTQLYTALREGFDNLLKALNQAGAGGAGQTPPTGQNPSTGTNPPTGTTPPAGQTPPAALPIVTITDVVPLAGADPTGAGLGTAGLPLTVGGLLCGVLVAAGIRGVWQRLVALVLAAAGGGAMATLILGSWLGIFPATGPVVFVAVSLSMLAIGGLFVGLHSLLGTAGFAVAALIVIVAALPWAGFAVPYQFLPAHLGQVGQWLPPGATGTLVRNLNYFPQASTWLQWVILGAWATLGLATTILGRAGRSPT
jgi:type II secretory pathway pseudopilin PulG